MERDVILWVPVAGQEHTAFELGQISQTVDYRENFITIDYLKAPSCAEVVLTVDDNQSVSSIACFDHLKFRK